MGIISYAQNFEDVMLWRALGHVEHGCYIDIGAHDPIVDSVSKAFYEHGWRGIHLEPLPVYCDALRRDRPDETVLQAAVAAETGVLRFFEIPDTGISTGDEAIAQSHRERGFRINEITVPCVTLAQVFHLVKGDVVHWLKIDVEGLEEQVLRGWGDSSLRPWIVVVESTLPLTQDEVFSTWEGLLLEKGYRCVYFDGLNRYYLAKEKSELKNAFRSGANVFDGFQLNGTATNTFTQHLAQSVRNEQASQIESLKQQALQQKTDEPCLAEALEELEKLKHALQAEQIANLQNQNAAKALVLQFEQKAREETKAQLRNAMRREQEFTAQLLASEEQLRQLESEHWNRQGNLLERLVETERRSSQEIAELTNAMKALSHLNELQAQKHVFIVDAHLNEYQRLKEAYAALESNFKAAVDTEQQINMCLRQTLAEVQQALAKIYASFPWRWTAPLRAFYFLILPKRSAALIDSAGGKGGDSLDVLPPVSNLASGVLSYFSPNLIMFPTLVTNVTNLGMAVTAASTLDELMGYNDQPFVLCAYLTLLKRAPDPEGLEYYLSRLRAGIPKIQVLAQMRISKEGKVLSVELPGLDGAIRRYQRAQNPLIGWLFRFKKGMEADQITKNKNILDSIDSLLVQNGAQFLHLTYRALLHREVDPGGFGHYMNAIRRGKSKRRIIYEIAISKEGRSVGARLNGLKGLIWRIRASRIPLVGRLLGLNKIGEGVDEIYERIAALEFMVNDQYADTSRMLLEHSASLDVIKYSIEILISKFQIISKGGTSAVSDSEYGARRINFPTECRQFEYDDDIDPPTHVHLVIGEISETYAKIRGGN